MDSSSTQYRCPLCKKHPWSVRFAFGTSKILLPQTRFCVVANHSRSTQTSCTAFEVRLPFILFGLFCSAKHGANQLFSPGEAAVQHQPRDIRLARLTHSSYSLIMVRSFMHSCELGLLHFRVTLLISWWIIDNIIPALLNPIGFYHWVVVSLACLTINFVEWFESLVASQSCRIVCNALSLYELHGTPLTRLTVYSTLFAGIFSICILRTCCDSESPVVEKDGIVTYWLKYSTQWFTQFALFRPQHRPLHWLLWYSAESIFLNTQPG